MNILNLIFGKKSESKLNDGEYLREYMIVGTSYACRKNKNVSRQSVLSKCNIGERVEIEPYVYNKKQAYMVVSPRLKLDLGVLSEGAAEHLATIPHKKFYAFLKERKNSSFIIDLYRI